MNEFQKRIKAATEKYITKETNPKQAAPSRRNKAPEKEVEKACLEWMRSQGFCISVVEAKATWSPSRQGYTSSSVKAGFSDSVGNDAFGFAVYVEFKAPGKLSTLRANQREFLTARIESGAFAVVVDSAESLRELYTHWQSLRARNKIGAAKQLLRSALPKERRRRSSSDPFDF